MGVMSWCDLGNGLAHNISAATFEANFSPSPKYIDCLQLFIICTYILLCCLD